MSRRPPGSTRTDTPFPDTTLFRSRRYAAQALVAEIAATGGKAFAVQADVGTLDGIRSMLNACDAAFGGAPNPDILVNNAGVGGEGDAGSLKKCIEELFDRMIAVNKQAPHFLTQSCRDRIRAQGHIVHVGCPGHLPA